MGEAVRRSVEETSLRRAFEGELRFMESVEPQPWWFESLYKRRHALNLQRRFLASWVEASELPSGAFWDGEPTQAPGPTWWDIVFDPFGAYYFGLAAPAYSDYALNIRYLEITAAVLRAWADTLSGAPMPPPGTTPDGLPHWTWRHDGDSLCLEPTADARRVPDTDRICQPPIPPR